MSGRSRTSDLVQAWAKRSALAAEQGAVCEENLRSLLQSSYDPGDLWLQAVEAYSVLLETLKSFEGSLKLIVGLTARSTLDITVPIPGFGDDLDRTSAPSLVVHRLVPRRDWEPFEQYRRPLDSPFLNEHGKPAAQAMYIAFRDQYDIADDGDYRRQVVFECVRSAPENAEA
jgi:hypothetical protein